MHVTRDSQEIIKLALEPHKMSEMQQGQSQKKSNKSEKIQKQKTESVKENLNLKKTKIRQTRTRKRTLTELLIRETKITDDSSIRDEFDAA